MYDSILKYTGIDVSAMDKDDMGPWWTWVGGGKGKLIDRDL